MKMPHYYFNLHFSDYRHVEYIFSFMVQSLENCLVTPFPTLWVRFQCFPCETTRYLYLLSLCTLCGCSSGSQGLWKGSLCLCPWSSGQVLLSWTASRKEEKFGSTRVSNIIFSSTKNEEQSSLLNSHVGAQS